MGKLEKIEQLRKLKDSGSLTEEEFQREKDKLLNNLPKEDNKKSIIVVIVIVLLIVCIGFGGYYFMNNNSSNRTIETSATDNKKQDSENVMEQASANILATNAERVSFTNMSGDDEDLTDAQKEIVNYFDNDYFYASGTEDFQRYPEIFKGSKINIGFSIKKVLKSNDNEFEVLAYSENIVYPEGEYDGVSINEIPKNKLFVIKGSQITKRLMEKDYGDLYGRYVDVEEYTIDGVSYTLPTFNAINIVRGERYDINTIETVAKSIFGNDIKVTEPAQSDYSILANYLPRQYQSKVYRVALDNQSNANFKVFDMDVDEGGIYYDYQYNDLSENIVKKLYVSSDFQHYIVSTYDSSRKHVYIDYFDRELKKVWSREFDYTSTKAFASPMDYTETQMAVVVDNDLFLIDLATGENIIEPVMVGEKIRVNMLKDGIVLIGDNNKDAIMKVDYTGKTIFKVNTNSTNIKIVNSAEIQIIDGKLVVKLVGIDTDDIYSSTLKKYLVINNSGQIESESEESEFYT